jgi:hypothetical protein
MQTQSTPGIKNKGFETQYYIITLFLNLSHAFLLYFALKGHGNEAGFSGVFAETGSS